MARTITRRSFIRRVSLIGAGGALANLVAACTGSSPAPAQPTSAPAAPAASPAAGQPPAASPAAPPVAASPAAAPPVSPPAAPASSPAAATGSGSVGRNTFTFLSRSEPPTIDPAQASDLPGRIVILQLYESLLRYEGVPPKLVPHLAESFDASPDAKTFTFKLRRGVRFHDGTDFKAEAVKVSMDRILTLNKGIAARWTAVLAPGDTQVVDEYTVKFNLKQAFAPFLATMPFFFVVSPDAIRKNQKPGPNGEWGDYAVEWIETNDAGTGPYILKTRETNAQITAAGNPGYWKPWDPAQYGTWIYKIVPEPATATLLARQKQADLVYEFYADSVFDDLAKVPGIKVPEDVGVKPMYMFLNNMREPTSNVNLRKAIAHAFDYNTAIKEIMAPLPRTQRLRGPLPENVPFHDPSLPLYETNLDMARSFLNQAGFKPGELTLDFGSFGGPADLRTKMGLLLQANLSQIGINMEITQLTWANAVAEFAKPDTTRHIYPIYLAYDYEDADALLFPGFHSSQHGSWSGACYYRSPEVDDWLVQGRSTTDQQKRAQLYQQIQRRIFDDCACLFVMNQPIRVALQDSVQGYKYETQTYNYLAFNFKKA